MLCNSERMDERNPEAVRSDHREVKVTGHIVGHIRTVQVEDELLIMIMS